MIAYWRYYTVDWFIQDFLSPDNYYQLSFTLTANDSTSRMTFVYNENAIPSATSYKELGSSKGNSIVIQLPPMSGSVVPQFSSNIVGYLGVYFGNDATASPIQYTISGGYKQVSAPGNNTVYYVLGGVGGALVLVGVVIAVVIVMRRRRRAAGYETIQNDH